MKWGNKSSLTCFVTFLFSMIGEPYSDAVLPPRRQERFFPNPPNTGRLSGPAELRTYNVQSFDKTGGNCFTWLPWHDRVKSLSIGWPYVLRHGRRAVWQLPQAWYVLLCKNILIPAGFDAVFHCYQQLQALLLGGWNPVNGNREVFSLSSFTDVGVNHSDMASHILWFLPWSSTQC